MNMYDENGTRKAPADADKIRLGQKIERMEADSGEPSAKRLLAERAVEVIRASQSLEDLRDRADKAACTVVIEDTIVNGKIRYQGFVKSDDGTGLKVKLSALPQDCRAGAIMKRFEEKTEVPAIKELTANQAKFHARAIFNGSSSMEEAETKLAEKGMSLERQGKSGCYLRFAEGDQGKIKLSSLGGKYSLSALNKKYNGNSSPYAGNMHGNQGKVNALSYKDAMKVQSDRASDRASSATERAVAVAAEAVQAKSIMEALDDAEAQAFALDTARRAAAQAAKATARAEAAEAREKALKERLAAKQQQEATADQKTAQTTDTVTTEQTTSIDVSTSETQNPGTNPAGNETALKTENPVNLNSENEKMDTYTYQRDRKAFVNEAGHKISLDAAVLDHNLGDLIRERAGEPADDKYGNFSVISEGYSEYDIDAKFALNIADLDDVWNAELEKPVLEKVGIEDSDWHDDVQKLKAEEEFDLRKYVNLDLCSGPVTGTADTSAAQSNAPADGPRLK